MEAKNFTLKTLVRFNTNSGSYDYQPFITLINNDSLTGGKFISVYRVRRSENESADITGIIANDEDKDGYLKLTFGDGFGLTSLTGSRRIRARSVVPPEGSDLTINSTTGEGREYTVSLISNINNDIDVVVEDNGLLTTDIKANNLSTSAETYNYIGLGVRPRAETIPPNGTTGQSLVLQYYYNAMEASGDTFTTSGLTGVYDWSGNSITANIIGKGAGDMASFAGDNSVSGTVTGHTYGPIEGGFRIDGNTHIKTIPSDLFSTRDETTSGFTLMTHVKLFASGNTDIISITDGTDTMASIGIREGSFIFSNDNGSVTAGTLTAVAENAGSADVKISRWVHLAATVDATTGSTSGTRLFVNGEPTLLTGIQETVSGSFTAIPEFSVPADAYGLIGINKDEISNGLTGVIGLTRIFNRPLTEAEIFENFITSIPSNVICNEINIA